MFTYLLETNAEKLSFELTSTSVEIKKFTPEILPMKPLLLPLNFLTRLGFVGLRSVSTLPMGGGRLNCGDFSNIRSMVPFKL